jgi:hypothetical protein
MGGRWLRFPSQHPEKAAAIVKISAFDYTVSQIEKPENEVCFELSKK